MGTLAGSNTLATTLGSQALTSKAPSIIMTPVVTASIAKLAANAGSIIIKGLGFSTTPGDDTVTLSRGVKGIVTAAAATQLTVTKWTGLKAGLLLTAIVSSNGDSSGAAVDVATIT